MPKVGNALGLYEVGATIIPVLFASLIFEAKALGRSDEVSERWSPLLLGVAIVLFAVVGEVAALKVLATQHPNARCRPGRHSSDHGHRYEPRGYACRQGRSTDRQRKP
jgi:hypothetical protein